MQDLIKKRNQHWCFSSKFAKFLRTPILKNICKGLLLLVSSSVFETMSKYIWWNIFVKIVNEENCIHYLKKYLNIHIYVKQDIKIKVLSISWENRRKKCYFLLKHLHWHILWRSSSCHWRRSGVFNVGFEKIPHIVLLDFQHVNTGREYFRVQKKQAKSILMTVLNKDLRKITNIAFMEIVNELFKTSFSII